MDTMYLLTTIKRIEEEMALHDQKFASNPVHANCLPRFESVIADLYKELQKETELAQKAGQSNN